jgi:hypothetical protein
LGNEFLGPKKLKFDISFIVMAEEIKAALDNALYDFIFFVKNL